MCSHVGVWAEGEGERESPIRLSMIRKLNVGLDSRVLRLCPELKSKGRTLTN